MDYLKHLNSEEEIERRQLLKGGAFMMFASLVGLPSLAEASIPGREVTFTNMHTGERFTGEYWQNGVYLPDAFGEIKTVLRDHRNNHIFPIDPRLMDILYVIQRRFNMDIPYEVYSGYRSPETNAMLHRISHGVAEHSLHMQGQAVDLRLPGIKLSDLRRKASRLKAGGVGYYPDSGFVHLDTGRVRQW